MDVVNESLVLLCYVLAVIICSSANCVIKIARVKLDLADPIVTCARYGTM